MRLKSRQAGVFVFPARAGMSRTPAITLKRPGRVPRASGDEPVFGLPTAYGNACSPRERG